MRYVEELLEDETMLRKVFESDLVVAKAQNALKAMRDELNSERIATSRMRKSKKKDAAYLKRKEKQKAQHRGK